MNKIEMIKEIQSEIWHVICLWIIITCGIMICDINQRIESYNFCEKWEYNLDAPIPNGFDRAIIDPDKKIKHRAIKYWKIS